MNAALSKSASLNASVTRSPASGEIRIGSNDSRPAVEHQDHGLDRHSGSHAKLRRTLRTLIEPAAGDVEEGAQSPRLGRVVGEVEEGGTAEVEPVVGEVEEGGTAEVEPVVGELRRAAPPEVFFFERAPVFVGEVEEGGTARLSRWLVSEEGGTAEVEAVVGEVEEGDTAEVRRGWEGRRAIPPRLRRWLVRLRRAAPPRLSRGCEVEEAAPPRLSRWLVRLRRAIPPRLRGRLTMPRRPTQRLPGHTMNDTIETPAVLRDLEDVGTHVLNSRNSRS